MGYRVSWVALSGHSRQSLLDLLGQEVTGERSGFIDGGWWLLEVSGDRPPWVVLIADGTETFVGLSETHAQRLSKSGGESLFFMCSDTVMATDLIAFRGGIEVWAIQHQGDSETRQPTLRGEVPVIVHQILADLQREQIAYNDADYLYDLTAEVGRELVGFRHDVDLDLDDPEPFERLTEPRKRSRPWWRFWS